jgi:hypothetical protein
VDKPVVLVDIFVGAGIAVPTAIDAMRQLANRDDSTPYVRSTAKRAERTSAKPRGRTTQGVYPGQAEPLSEDEIFGAYGIDPEDLP